MFSNSKTLFFVFSAACTLASCDLSAPPNVGEYCPGIEQINVMHISSDECDKNKNCPEEDAVAIEMGYCHQGLFVSIPVA